jgi:hypothetical protein
VVGAVAGQVVANRVYGFSCKHMMEHRMHALLCLVKDMLWTGRAMAAMLS